MILMLVLLIAENNSQCSGTERAVVNSIKLRDVTVKLLKRYIAESYLLPFEAT
jgi:hypothetical protein